MMMVDADVGELFSEDEVESGVAKATIRQLLNATDVINLDTSN